ncbi:MAG: SprB repeat-containing protein [Flavobacteriales bacterium]|nr:SprB repeat-containing protein [Flavobacteriales bacterium]
MRALLSLVLLAAATAAQAQLPPCDVTFNISPITCPDFNDGAIAVITTSGGPYTYTWTHDDLETGASVFNLEPGFYSVTVTDGTTCETVLDTLLTEPYVAPLGTMAVTPPTCAGLADGSITFTVNPGPYTWQWVHDPTITSATISNLNFGVYSVVVFGGPSPCPAIVTTSIGEPNITLVGTTDYCPSDPPVITAQLDWGFAPDQLVWSTGATGFSYTVEPGFSGLLSVTGTNTATGCSATDDILITELPSPS